jgi:hypothetical protein
VSQFYQWFYLNESIIEELPLDQRVHYLNQLQQIIRSSVGKGSRRAIKSVLYFDAQEGLSNEKQAEKQAPDPMSPSMLPKQAPNVAKPDIVLKSVEVFDILQDAELAPEELNQGRAF